MFDRIDVVVKIDGKPTESMRMNEAVDLIQGKPGSTVTLSVTRSPANKLIPDPSLRVGQRRQVDWAAPGATTRVVRSFTRAGKVYKTDTLNSRYVPWPNIFMVGTRQ